MSLLLKKKKNALTPPTSLIYDSSSDKVISLQVVDFSFCVSCVLSEISACVCRFAGYDTGACKQPTPVVYTLKLLIGAAPVAFIVTGLMILLLYPISEDVRLRNKVCLDELRQVEFIKGHLLIKRGTPPILMGNWEHRRQQRFQRKMELICIMGIVGYSVFLNL